MAQIHNVEVTKTKRYITDPAKGLTLVHDDHIQKGSATAINYGNETYEIDADGSFDVSDEAAAFLCKQPGWYEGPNPFPPEVEAAPTRKPSKAKAAA
jgi:hypothetical protein